MPLPSAGEILTHVARALEPDGPPAARTFETSGVVRGEGVTGTFHSWEDGDRERDDEQLGLRSERTLRIGQRVWVQNASGNVRELHGVLLRRSNTERFIDSNAFLRAPERVRVTGTTVVGGRSAYELEVTAPDGDPETVDVDRATYLPVRFSFIDGDGQTTIEPSKWRVVGGRLIAGHSVVSDGEHLYDLVQTTTDARAGAPIDPSVFAPLPSHTISADGVQTVPLIERDGHYFCTASIDGKPFTFLIDSGAQNVLIDSRVVRELGLAEEGTLELRGMTRSGGLHAVRLGRLTIGQASIDGIVASSINIGTSTGGAFRLDGILGYPFFASGLVQLDFAHHTMLVGPPGSFVPHGTKLALDVDRGLAEAVLEINGGSSAPFIVDTGSSEEVLLFRPFVDRHPGIVPFTGISGSDYGFGGASTTYRTVLDSLSLGGYALYHRRTDVVLATRGAFADLIDAGNVGMGVLRNFVLTFDENDSALYVDRGASFDDGRDRRIVL